MPPGRFERGKCLRSVRARPHRGSRLGPGVVLSQDSGKTLAISKLWLPLPDIWSVAYDRGKRGRMYCSVHEEAVYVSVTPVKAGHRTG
jgi:hypothetical protein